MELVISVVVGILIVEAYAWLPKISAWLIDRAAQRLRSEDQDRCREEWKAGLDALPNTIIKFVHALSFLGAANRINADFFENKLAEINALTEECVHKHSGAVAIFGANQQDGRLQLRELLGRYLQLSGLKARMMEVPNEEVAFSLQKAGTTLETAAETFEKLADTSASAIGAQVAMLTVIARMIERLNHVKCLLLRASEKRDQVTAVLGHRDVSPDMLDAQLAELRSDLHTVKNIFEDDKWGDDHSLRIAAAIAGGDDHVAAAIAGAVRRVLEREPPLNKVWARHLERPL
jgi:hypothetical protein